MPQLFACNDMTALFQQQCQKLKGLVLELDPGPIARQRKGGHIKGEKAEAIDDSRSAGLISVGVIQEKALPAERPPILARSSIMPR